MPTIHVCPLHLVPSEAERLRPSRLVTLLSPSGAMPERPEHLAPDQHLVRLFHDIANEAHALTPPSRDDVQAVIDFARGWDQQAPLLIHCYAGISRSSAASLISAIAVRPDQDDERLVQGLRKASPTASPNPRMISIADLMLGRDGRLVGAVRNLKPAEFAPSGQPFQLPIL